MAMINAKTVENTIKIFTKEQGREPTFNELRELLAGRSLGKKETEVKE